MRGLIIATVALIAFSGCFGLPAGAADFGDTVTVRYVALDAETGEALSGPLATMRTFDIGGAVHYDGHRLETAIDSSFDDVPGHIAAWFDDDSDVMHRSISVSTMEGQLANIRNSAEVLADAGAGCGPDSGTPVVVNGQQHVTHASVADCLDAVVADVAAALADAPEDQAIQQANSAAESLADPAGIYTLIAVHADRVMDDVVKRYPGALGATAKFELGSGASGLGFAFERNLVGQQVNATLHHEDHDGDTRGFSEERRIDREQNRIDLEFTETLANLPEVTEGEELPTGVDGIVVQVLSVGNTTATLRFDFESGIPVDVGHGVEAAYVHDGEQLWLDLDPAVGEVFTVVPNPQRPDPFGLEPGSYQTLDSTDSEIIYGYSASQNVELITAPLDVYVKVLEVERGEAEVPTENYGKRTSPVLPHGHARSAGEADDGHDDHTH